MVKTLLLASALMAGGLLGLEGRAHAHGGQYRGPGDTVPPGGQSGGSGGTRPPGASPVGPTVPGNGPTTGGTPGLGIPGGGPSRPGTGGSDLGPDLTQWSFWWEFNKDLYLRLKDHIHNPEVTSGTEGWFLGLAATKQGQDSLKPSEQQVRASIVPALLESLTRETNNDVVTGCLVALAKIGDLPSESGASAFEPVIRPFLKDPNQEIRETAAMALGILGSPGSLDTLEALVRNTSAGKEHVGENTDVDARTRAFAAYGLGLIGSRAGSEGDRVRIVRALREVLSSDDTRTRDLQVGCVIAMGLVALDTIETPPIPAAANAKGAAAPALAEVSRSAQLDFLLAFLGDDDRPYLIRAHCPTALARLLAREGWPAARHEAYRQEIGAALLERIEQGKVPTELLQSCVLALGLLGTNDGNDPLDRRIRAVLADVPRNLSDVQARHFAMIALARVGGTMGASDPDAGIDEVRGVLLKQLATGKSALKPWAGLSCGVMVAELARNGYSSTAVTSLQLAVRASLKAERNPVNLGAYALAAGIMGDVEAIPLLTKRLASENDDTALGYVAVSLGLMKVRDSIEPIQRIVEESKYRPERLRQCAIALGLLGDKAVVSQLARLLGESQGLASQASLSAALGIIGDRGSVEPLVRMLRNSAITPRARGFAAVALGIVADGRPLPWNSAIARDLNYRASTETLTGAAGTGILDIL